MEENITRFLRNQESQREILMNSKGDLFTCLDIYIENEKRKQSTHLKTIFKDFMQQEEERMLFQSILPLLDNSGNVPKRSRNCTENNSNDNKTIEADFQRRLQECYDSIVRECDRLQPYSDFLHVYLFAVATLFARLIYVHHEDEAGELSWAYFRALFPHTYEEVVNPNVYYITLLFTSDDCYVIDSSRCPNNHPVSFGRIGLYQKLSKSILLHPETVKSCVQEILEKLEHTVSLHKVLSSAIIGRTLQLYRDRCSLRVSLPSKILGHRPDKELFVTELGKNARLTQCFYEASLESAEGYKIWRRIGVSKDFLPLVFHDLLLYLENAVLELEDNISDVIGCLVATDADLTDRRSKVNKAVIGGSVTGFVGAGLAVAGLALAPVTAGVSLGLTIAGASVGAIGGITGGAPRAYEAVKQNITINNLSTFQKGIVAKETDLVERIFRIEEVLEQHSERQPRLRIDGPGMNMRGFLALGSAFRTLHGGVAVGIAALRVGSVGATVAASVLGPLSLAIDLGFLIEAAHNLRKGSKTGAGETLVHNANILQMKMAFFMCMLRGNIPSDKWIVT